MYSGSRLGFGVISDPQSSGESSLLANSAVAKRLALSDASSRQSFGLVAVRPTARASARRPIPRALTVTGGLTEAGARFRDDAPYLRKQH